MHVPDVSPDLPSAGWRATLALLRRLPQAGLSRSLGRLADVPLPRVLRRPVLRTFARAVGAQLGEVEKPLEEYASVNAFFVRRLRPGARSGPSVPGAAASPVDGIVGTVGEIEGGTAVQAKGRRYSVGALLGDPAAAPAYEGGRFVTLYLSPRHYHRVHSPVAGTLALARHVPGQLFPVNAPAVAHVPELFARNERVLCLIDSRLGRVAVVAVGAYNVARISTAFDPDWGGPRGWVSNRRDAPSRPRERRYDPPLPIERGSELMAFHLGSTVILLFPPGATTLTPICRPGREVRLGEPLVRSIGRGDLSSSRLQPAVGTP
jgi:phosphatidylserine decarboxylase